MVKFVGDFCLEVVNDSGTIGFWSYLICKKQGCRGTEFIPI